MIPALSESGAPSGLHSALGQIHCYSILSSIGHITQKKRELFSQNK